jgi:hypothetical protein
VSKRAAFARLDVVIESGRGWLPRSGVTSVSSGADGCRPGTGPRRPRPRGGPRYPAATRMGAAKRGRPTVEASHVARSYLAGRRPSGSSAGQHSGQSCGSRCVGPVLVVLDPGGMPERRLVPDVLAAAGRAAPPPTRPSSSRPEPGHGAVHEHPSWRATERSPRWLSSRRGICFWCGGFLWQMGREVLVRGHFGACCVTRTGVALGGWTGAHRSDREPRHPTGESAAVVEVASSTRRWGPSSPWPRRAGSAARIRAAMGMRRWRRGAARAGLDHRHGEPRCSDGDRLLETPGHHRAWLAGGAHREGRSRSSWSASPTPRSGLWADHEADRRARTWRRWTALDEPGDAGLGGQWPTRSSTRTEPPEEPPARRCWSRPSTGAGYLKGSFDAEGTSWSPAGYALPDPGSGGAGQVRQGQALLDVFRFYLDPNTHSS